jgi:tRNA dimethylallyltransferase
MKKTCFVVVGPTAVGKTSLALHLAQSFNTQIISADSRQCYKELNIGVAKPSVQELAATQHYFINSHSIFDEVNAGLFEAYALDKITQIFEQNDYAVLVGGTGLYIKAFCEGIDAMPPIEADLRKNIIEQYHQNGLLWLQQEVAQKDPVFYSKGEIENPQRLMRALEIKLSTGQSIFDFQFAKKKERSFNIVKIGLELPRDFLYKQINDRVDAMIKAGLPDEVENFIPHKNLNALQTVGYKELFNFFENKTSKNEAIEMIKLNTRHYAKRQLTWFAKDKNIKWFDAANKYINHLVHQTILEAVL